MRKKSQGKIHFDSNRCKGCELCIAVCPANIISLDRSVNNTKGYHPATVTHMDQCTACCSCALICPDCIITIEKLAA